MYILLNLLYIKSNSYIKFNNCITFIRSTFDYLQYLIIFNLITLTMNTEIKNFFLPIWSNKEVGRKDNPYPYFIGNCICSDKSLLDLFAETPCSESQYINGMTWRVVYDDVTSVLLTYMIKRDVDDLLALDILHTQSLLNRLSYVVNIILQKVDKIESYDFERISYCIREAIKPFPSNFAAYTKLIALVFDEELKKINL